VEVARYGKQFKDRVVARLLPPESAAPERVSREVGVTVQTLERWRSDALLQPARERIWTAAARLEAVIATAAPPRGFADLEAAREWARCFVRWYNHDHRHSGIRYVGPAQRHEGLDRPILAGRHALYLAARERHPRRWSRHTRNWSPIEVVTLNPDRETVAGSIENEMSKASQAA
jgi:hypothetical protein